jgi:hypothetical protein
MTADIFRESEHDLIDHKRDDRLDVFIGGTHLMTLARGRAHPSGKHDHVVDYRRVISSLRRKPMALLNLVYRNRLFPREAYRRTFDILVERPPEKKACRIMVDLRFLAHDRGCEAELAGLLAAAPEAGSCFEAVPRSPRPWSWPQPRPLGPRRRLSEKDRAGDLP